MQKLGDEGTPRVTQERSRQIESGRFSYRDTLAGSLTRVRGQAATCRMLFLAVLAAAAGSVEAATYNVVADAYTTTNQATTNFGSDPVVRIQKWADHRGHARFDLPGTPQPPVDLAMLRIPVSSVGKAGVISIYRVQAAWTEAGITHANRPSIAATPAAMIAVTIADIGNTISVDVTALVNQWLASPASNFGLALVPGDMNVWIDSREASPGMSIETSSLVATPTPTNRYPQSGDLNQSRNPTLDLSCTTANLDATQYQISAQLSFAAPIYDSGEQLTDICSHRANSNLAALATLYWRGRQRVQNGSWSAWSSPTLFTVGDATGVVNNQFQDGTLAYAGTHDADIRGSGANPLVAIRNWNQGAQDVLRVGRRPAGSASDEIYRSLIRFDVSELTDASKVVNAWIEFTGWQHDDASHNQDVRMVVSAYRLRRAWGEGNGTTEAPVAGESSWVYSANPQAWAVAGAASAHDTAAGADRAATPAITARPRNLAGLKSTWSSRELTNLVRTWITNPADNHGLLFKANDDSLRQVLNLGSSEHASTGFRPVLVIESTESVSVPGGGQQTFSASADAYTKNNEVNTNFGSDTLVRVLKFANQTAFVRFDFGAGAPTSVTSAILSLSANSVVKNGTISIRKVLGNWSESTLTESNKPALGPAVTSFPVTLANAGQTLQVDITVLVNQLLANPAQNFGIALHTGDANFWIDSRESDRPMQIIAQTSGTPTNVAPTVNASADQSVTLPAAASLAGTVSDDGLPNPPGQTTVGWSKLSGPGTVSFGNAASAVTSATFSVAGSYELRLLANDGALSASDTLTVSVQPAPVNQAPVSNAGIDLNALVNSTVALQGSLSDDGLPVPPGTVSATWSKVSGPGTVTFGNNSSPTSTASFSATGGYVLRLTANDSQLQHSDDVNVTVTAPGGEQTLAVFQDAYTKNNTASTNYGSDTIVRVQNFANMTGFVRFDLSSLAAGTTVSAATLRLRADTVNLAGTIAVHKVLGAWQELTLTENSKPALGPATTNFQVSTTDAGKDVLVDVTDVVNQLLANRSNDFGFALVPVNVNLWIRSRESGPVMQLVLVAGGPPSLAFTDITAETGTAGPSHFGGHGSQFADVNNDGFPDVYVTMNDTSFGDMAELFYRDLDGSQFAEEATPRGIDNFDDGSHGGVFADFDNDGDFDLYNGSYNQNRLYRNDGTGMYSDITSAAGLPNRQWPTRGVAAFDMDRDGDLDIVGINGFLGSGDPATERNEYYRNNGNGTFTAIDMEPLFSAPAGQGITDVDYNNDGYVDLFVGNRSGDVVILRNVGGTGFELVAPANIGITHIAGDGISFADVNNDGHLDALLDDQLYVADGDGTFTHRAFLVGPGTPYMGGFSDLDLDGDVDIVFPGASYVYLNDGSGNFSPGPSFVLGPVADPRSVSFSDIDNDGDTDFFYAQKGTYNILIRNDYFGSNRWLQVSLIRGSGQVGAYGARIYLYQAGHLNDPARLVTWRELRSQDGYLSQSDPRQTLGVGTNATVDVKVVFPGGVTSTMLNVASDQHIFVQE